MSSGQPLDFMWVLAAHLDRAGARTSRARRAVSAPPRKECLVLLHTFPLAFEAIAREKAFEKMALPCIGTRLVWLRLRLIYVALG